jgi:predicted DNA-binding transcriptional regulator YafY
VPKCNQFAFSKYCANGWHTYRRTKKNLPNATYLHKIENMPTNKHASFRYRVLNACFRRPRRWSFDDLIEEVSEQLYEAFGTRQSVSKRTIQYDINLMRSAPPLGFDAPIVCEEGKYFYGDRNFSIENKPLTEKDITAIKGALGVLQQFNGLPQFQALADTLNRMEGWVKYPEWSIIQFETNDQAAGTEWLELLYQGALEGKSLHITYHPFVVDEPYQLVFHPYYLREYRNRWFVFGLHDELGVIHTLALDRVKAVKSSRKRFQPNTIFEPDTYFLDLIGVTRPASAEPVEIVFKTTDLLSKYLETKPLHRSQTLRRREGEVAEFSIRVIPNYELYSELARFGKALKVIGPESVQAAMLDF